MCEYSGRIDNKKNTNIKLWMATENISASFPKKERKIADNATGILLNPNSGAQGIGLAVAVHEFPAL